MTITFVHTADWQLGKPFAGIADEQKRIPLQKERIRAIERIGAVAQEHDADFIVVAGDVFDSSSPTKQTVAEACAAIGQLGRPVFVIPGNHDHGGEESLWTQEFFLREQRENAPNLHILLKAEPIVASGAVLLPCPLLRRHEATDTTSWLRVPPSLGALSSDAPRIVIAHGSVQDFGMQNEDDEIDIASTNVIDLDRLAEGAYDYVALGDWHGGKQVSDVAWYSGTPEQDRFGKGTDYAAGHVLVVRASRGRAPHVESVRTGAMGWHELEHEFAGDASLDALEERLRRLVGGRAGMDLVKLTLSGYLGLEATARLERLIESQTARLIRLKLVNQTVVMPDDAELARLTERHADPLLARVATRLVAMMESGTEQGETARVALRELYSSSLN